MLKCLTCENPLERLPMQEKTPFTPRFPVTRRRWSQKLYYRYRRVIGTTPLLRQTLSPSVAESEQEVRPEGEHFQEFFSSSMTAEIQRIEVQDALAARVAKCVSAAFDAMGISPASQQLILWNVSAAKKLRLEEVVDRPADFVDGLRTLWGGAAASVFEHKLMKEVKREFDLESRLNKVALTLQTLPELLQYATSRIGD